MSNITNTDPVVTESKLTEFYNDIKPFLGCPAYVTQEGDEMYCSTEEKVVGRWIDNKPIYVKTIEHNAIPKNAETTIASLPEAERLVYVYGSTNGSSSTISSTIPCRNFCIYLNANKDLVAYQNLEITSGKLYVIVMYTKTADSAVTTTEQKPTHYSTDEQIVGTWTDGKPVYQRTYTTTTPNASSNGSYAYKTIAHNITNVDKFVEIKGTLTSSDFSSVLPFFTDGGNKTKFNINATDISIANDCVYSNGRNLIFTVRYTKTTDT